MSNKPHPEAAVEIKVEIPELPPLDMYEIWYCKKKGDSFVWVCDDMSETLEGARSLCRHPDDRIFHLCDPDPAVLSDPLVQAAIKAAKWERHNPEAKP